MMNSWTRVIIEWANCLGIVESTIDSLHDLNAGGFCEKLVSQLCRGNDGDFSPTARKSLDSGDTVSKFIQAEYPDYVRDSSIGITDDVGTASLLLAQCCQQPVFHRPMCVALRHETQIQIKRFLEMVLPCGKNLTRETLSSAIAELGESGSNEDSAATPQIRPLREFFNSPAVRSARSQRFMNDRNRELMCLRAQLETEQFEKADLLQDMKAQSERISAMQKKLQEKSRELRELRNERFKPVTPQSCRKNRPSDNEERLRREVESLEDANLELSTEIERLRDEREELARNSNSKDNLIDALREKYEQSEKNSESLLQLLEVKNREVNDLRINSEELREHIRQMKRSSIGDLSFADLEPKCAEALSSIVDIQLQEAREESALLRNELSEVKLKLSSLLQDSEKLRTLEIVLQEKKAELDEMQSRLCETENRLSASSEKSMNLERENSRLIEDSIKLRDLVQSKCESLEIIKKKAEALENDLCGANSRNEQLEINIEEEKSRIVELRTRISLSETESTDLRRILAEREEKLSQITRDKESLILNLNEKTRDLRQSEITLEREKSEIVNLKSILASREEEYRNLEEKIVSRDGQISILNEEKNMLKQNLERSKLKIVESLESLKMKKSENEELRLSSIQAEREFKNLLESNEKLFNSERSRNIELESIISREKRENESLQKMLDESKIALIKEKTENDELRVIIDDSKKLTNELESLLETKEKILEESTMREKSLANDLESCKEKLEKLEISLSNETLINIELASELSLAKKINSDLEAELMRKKISLEEAEDAKKTIQTELQDANVEIERIKENVETLKKQIALVENDKVERISANRKLEEYARDADEKLVNVEIKISNYERQIRQLDETSAENKRNLETLRAELDEKNYLVDSLNLSIDEVNKSSMELTELLKSSDKKIAELMELREEMESQLSQEREKKLALENKIITSTELAEMLRGQISEIENDFQRSEKNLEIKMAECEELRKNIENLTTMNQDLGEKLKEERNKCAIIYNEKIDLKEKLESHVASEEKMRLEIFQLEREVEKSTENLRAKSEEILSLENKILSSTELAEKLSGKIVEFESHFHRSEEKLARQIAECEELKKNIENLTTTNGAFEEKLKEEKNQFAILESEKFDLKEQLDSHVDSEESMRHKISQLELDVEKSTENVRKKVEENISLENKIFVSTELVEKLNEKMSTIESDFHRSEEELERQMAEVEKLRKNIENLTTTNKVLEEQLKEERRQSAILESEKSDLKDKLDSHVNSEDKMRKKNSALELEVEKYVKNLGEKVVENSSLKEKILSLTDFAEIVQKNLFDETERVKTLENEIKNLTEELSSFSRGKADMIEEISALHKELEGSRSDLEKLRETSTGESDKLREKIEDLMSKSELRAEKINLLERDLENSNLENKRLNERLEDSSSNIASLEKRLMVAQNSREEAKLEEKLTQESLQVVTAKLEKLNKEKIENELKMKEVIMNLQELRTSQDQVLEAQIKTLEEKSDRLLLMEKERENLKNSLTTATLELESEKSRIKEIEMNFDKLRLKNEQDSKIAEQLDKSLSRVREKSDEAEKNCESLKSKMAKIKESSNTLKVELNSLWDSVRTVCPELARPKRKINEHGDGDSSPEVVETLVVDVKTIRRVVSILSEANETLKERLDAEKENSVEMAEREKKKKLELEERLTCAEAEIKKRDLNLSLLGKRRRAIQELLSRAIDERNKLDNELSNHNERWKQLNAQARTILTTGSSACDETKNLRVKRNELDETFANFHERHAKNSKNLLEALCRIFLWSETKLQEAHDVSRLSMQEEFSPETELSREIRQDELMRESLGAVAKKISEFSDSLDSYETSLKAGILKSNCEGKLQAQLDKVTRERKELRDKLEAARVRNAKMEKNLDELRNANKKIQSEISDSTSDEDRAELERLREFTRTLQDEKEELTRRLNDRGDIDARLEIVHKEYGQKLERIKEKMKTAYNEQMAKVNQEQERAVREKMNALKSQMEQQCRKYTEDIAKYKAHISDLSSRYWDVGEKLLAETQEKQAAIQQLQRLKGKQQNQEAVAEVNEQAALSRHKTASLDRREFASDRGTKDSSVRSGYRAVEVIEEETTTFSTRRHSVKSIQAMGNAFKAEDEEGEVFDSVFLADLKEGRCATEAPDYDRLTQLRMRNSMCKPHLKSSYAVETHLQPVALNEDDIKNGVAGDDVFNDSLSQSLLPGQKPKKRDRTQTSYKRPGPPTPSKNGGRLSLQGNELKSPSSRILKERNTDRRTTATPRGLKNLFGASMSKRQDENSAGTPKGRRLSNIFRKQRPERN